METDLTIISLGVDPATGLEKRAIFSRLICMDITKEFVVEYKEQLLSPTGIVVQEKHDFMTSTKEEYNQFDSLVGGVIRTGIETAIKNRYGIQ